MPPHTSLGRAGLAEWPKEEVTAGPERLSVALAKLSNTWNPERGSLRIKLRLFNTAILSAVKIKIWACEGWRGTESLGRRGDALQEEKKINKRRKRLARRSGQSMERFHHQQRDLRFLPLPAFFWISECFGGSHAGEHSAGVCWWGWKELPGKSNTLQELEAGP